MAGIGGTVFAYHSVQTDALIKKGLKQSLTAFENFNITSVQTDALIKKGLKHMPKMIGKTNHLGSDRCPD